MNRAKATPDAPTPEESTWSGFSRVSPVSENAFRQHPSAIPVGRQEWCPAITEIAATTRLELLEDAVDSVVRGYEEFARVLDRVESRVEDLYRAVMNAHKLRSNDGLH